ncbi:MAG: hypothetical protein GAK45_00321 [Pseudomonas citronellolis]|nr:MAG: hypothetical protein GAK45_00321 [Pseudomonas citronellolis]
MNDTHKALFQQGHFSVMELFDQAPSGADEALLGFIVTGPGADSGWVFDTLDEAINEARLLSSRLGKSAAH